MATLSIIFRVSLDFLVAFLIFSNASAIYNLKVTPISPTSVQVEYKDNETAAIYVISIVQRHNLTNTKEYKTNATTFTVSGLKSNVIYDTWVEKHFLNQTSTIKIGPVSARTGINGCEIKNYFAARRFIVVFLEKIPVATEWILKHENKRTNATTYLTFPTNGPTKSYYVHVVTNLDSHTNYTFFCRVSKILNETALNETLSPFRETKTIVTEQPLVFGKVILSSIPFTPTLRTNLSFREAIEGKLLSLYNLRSIPKISGVEIEELAQSSLGNTQCWYELAVDGVNDNGLFIKLSNLEQNNLINPQEEINVAGNDFYWYSNDKKVLVGQSVRPSDNCQWKDERTWILHDEYGGRVEKLLAHGRESNGDPSSSQKFNFTEKYLTYTGKSSGQKIFQFNANTIYAIEHDYLVKTCPQNTQTLFYDRLETAERAETLLSSRYTIVYTTGPGPMKNTCPFVEAFPGGFNIEPVSKAIGYQFSLKNESGFEIGRKVINEDKLDSSGRIQVLFSSFTRFQTYYFLDMLVTTRLANGQTATSPVSTFSFFSANVITDINSVSQRNPAISTRNQNKLYKIFQKMIDFWTCGLPFTERYKTTFLELNTLQKNSPNETNLILYNASVGRFSVEWNPVNCSTGFIIQIRNESFSRNLTTSVVTQNHFQGFDESGVYFVKIASFNNFGQSRFSQEKRFPFWNFQNISDSSFTLLWVSNFSRYDITIQPHERGFQNTSVGFHFFDGLQAGTTYQVNVTAIDSKNEQILLLTDTQITIPPKPKILNLSATLTSISLNWLPARGATHYQWNLESTLNQTIKTSTTFSTGVVIENLKAGRRYKFKILSQNSAGQSSFSQVDVQTVKDIPNIFTTSDDLSNTSFTARWIAARDAIYYVVNVTSLNTSQSTIKNSSSTLLQVTDLNPGHVYAVDVEAVYENGRSKSNPAYQLLPPPAPKSITHTDLSKILGFSIEWASSFGAERYNVSAITKDYMNINKTTKSTEVAFSDVCGKAEYRIRIAAFNKAGSSETTYFFNSEGYAPADLELVSVMEDSVSMNWKRVVCAISYEISVSKEALNTRRDSVSHSTSHSFANLNSSSAYLLGVRANYSNGLGPSTDLQFITAAANPTFIIVINVTSSSIKISWPPKRLVFNYRVVIENQNNELDIQNYGGNETQALILNLKAARLYKISIRTVSDVGHHLPLFENRRNSPSISVVTATTFPESLTFKKISDEFLSLTWSKPQGAVSFVVKVSEASGDQLKTTFYNVTDNKLNISNAMLQVYSYEILVYSVNSQGHRSAPSLPVVIAANLAMINNFPWLLILAASGGFLLLVLIGAIITINLKKKKKLQNPNKYGVEEEQRKRIEMRYNVFGDSDEIPNANQTSNESVTVSSSNDVDGDEIKQTTFGWGAAINGTEIDKDGSSDKSSKN